jgi:hypothetical protein
MSNVILQIILSGNHRFYPISKAKMFLATLIVLYHHCLLNLLSLLPLAILSLPLITLFMINGCGKIL